MEITHYGRVTSLYYFDFIVSKLVDGLGPTPHVFRGGS
jgi:hypothetical protein